MSKKNKYIVCPNCGAEYLVSEIFVPEALVGKEVAKRDVDGHIVEVEGKESCLQESYVCDYCDNAFLVVANLKFGLRRFPQGDRSLVTRIPLKSNIELEED